MLAIFVLASCQETFLDRTQISTDKYAGVMQELLLNKKAIDSIYMDSTKKVYDLVIIDSVKNSSKGILPKTFELFKNKEIYMIKISSGCIFFVLKIHDENMGATYECLRRVDQGQCNFVGSNNSDIKYIEKLDKEWEYLRISIYSE